VKVWIYKGDILPYKLSSEDKISREAAMAAGETSGQARPRRLITAGGGRRRADQVEPGAPQPEVVETEDVDTGVETGQVVEPVETEEQPTVSPLPGTVPADGQVDDLERLLAEEEEIERRTRNEHHEAPHFRKEND
jgi:small subunit ribosomal protein S3